MPHVEPVDAQHYYLLRCQSAPLRHIDSHYYTCRYICQRHEKSVTPYWRLMPRCHYVIAITPFRYYASMMPLSSLPPPLLRQYAICHASDYAIYFRHVMIARA